MNYNLQNNRYNQTEITDTETLKAIWLGMRDSNPRILVPETSALPLGQSPIANVAWLL
jgi:hypothetical protein